MNVLTKITRYLYCKGPSLNFSNRLSTIKLSNISPIVQVTHLNHPWVWQQKHPFEIPLLHNIKLELPNNIKSIEPLIDQSIIKKEIEAPSVNNYDIPKQAARLIVIRRKKMKKHKLKKLRKKMKFEWAKIRQRRELKKEKAFQAILIQQCKEAEAFSAEKYVAERLEKLNEVMIPRFSKGKSLPEFIIREKMGLPPKK